MKVAQTYHSEFNKLTAQCLNKVQFFNQTFVLVDHFGRQGYHQTE
ncbi:MAG: hypothetical protein WBO44_13575 [Saprospiraceae bacterium]